MRATICRRRETPQAASAREAAEVSRYRSLAVNNNRTTVVVSIAVTIVVAFNDNGLVAISAIPILEVFTVAIAITMTFTHRDANGTHTDPDLLRPSGNCAKNAHHGGHCYCVSDHCLLLLM
jgi:hypothetical protein